MNVSSPGIFNNLGRWDYISEPIKLDATSTPTAGSSSQLILEGIFFRETKTKRWYLEITGTETLSSTARTGTVYAINGIDILALGPGIWSLSCYADSVSSAPKCAAFDSTNTIIIVHPSTTTTVYSINGLIPLNTIPTVYVPDFFA
jgi:hypothetical protein